MDHSHDGLPGVDSAKTANGVDVSLKMCPQGEERQIIVIDPAGGDNADSYVEIAVELTDLCMAFRVGCLLHKWIREHTIHELGAIDDYDCAEILGIPVAYVDCPSMYSCEETVCQTLDGVEVIITYGGIPVIFTLSPDVGERLHIVIGSAEDETHDGLLRIKRRLRRIISENSLQDLLDVIDVEVWNVRLNVTLHNVFKG